MYICVTHVDADTKIPGFKAPMRNGPTFPSVKGLNIEWWDGSKWPLTHPDQYPCFFGTCDNDADTNIDGVIKVFEDMLDQEGNVIYTAQKQYEDLQAEEMRARLPSTASPMRLRLALLEMELLDSVKSYVDALEEPQKSKVLIMWEYSTEINKNHPAVQHLATALEITSEQLDDLFVLANTLNDDPFYTPEPQENTPE